MPASRRRNDVAAVAKPPWPRAEAGSWRSRHDEAPFFQYPGAHIMSRLARTTAFLAALATLAAPLAAQAQANGAPVTRAQVYGELEQIEQAGYDPHKISPHYPADIQAAQSKLQPAEANVVDSGYGTAGSGSVASGNRMSAGARQSLFAHH
jgi:hypothetical protein